jgi:hypothetical protein
VDEVISTIYRSSYVELRLISAGDSVRGGVCEQRGYEIFSGGLDVVGWVRSRFLDLCTD